MLKEKKLVLVALNAKYVHTSLAVRALRAACKDTRWQVEIIERSIGDPLDAVAEQIVRAGAQIVGFSCTIWNVTLVARLCALLRAAGCSAFFLLGGPEVSFEGDAVFTRIPEADAVICGEGEAALRALLQSYPALPREIPGLCLPGWSNVRPTQVDELDQLPFPYEGGEGIEPGRILYYEASRGCPFHCGYCLSGETQLRQLPLPRVKAELRTLMAAGVRQVKFVDRTFNADPARARELFGYLMALDRELEGSTNFHFEIGGQLLDEETLDLLEEARKGLFQFEIGVQSTDRAALDAVGRKDDFQKITRAVQRLRRAGRIHLHLDLIAGLPGEGYARFAASFNDVYALTPDMLQLGFLKLLRGSRLRREEKLHGYAYDPYPPYEITASRDITYLELRRLKAAEEALERYYNAHLCDRTLRYLISVLEGDAFRLFQGLGEYAGEIGLPWQGRTPLQRMEILYAYAKAHIPGVDLAALSELLRFDLLEKEKRRGLPLALAPLDTPETRKKIRALYGGAVHSIYPAAGEMEPYALRRATHIEPFRLDIAAFEAVGALQWRACYWLFRYDGAAPVELPG
ncbi:DUF4080 domain-containing protein [Christensenellaceae bacterium NSJ-44]|uniref:DUF4080 domain-containing protein n=1 Tax=Luoshenia tenuis TaxID=2763654 RepID=A0A926HM32_9FIRM|nr:DUF4080 domain-containing protein [Luoshenia tenuis]MBC8528185.1 DUF4080 domain-containing protein [Luoshenia tenuis]